MFDQQQIPSVNPQINQYLNGLYAQSGANAESKAAIEKKIGKVDNTIKDKILTTTAISEYFDEIWNHPELKDKHKDFVITKLEAIQQAKKEQIINNKQKVSQSMANLDEIIESFKMTPYEEFNMQEKLKQAQKKKNVELDNYFLPGKKGDPDVLRSLNRPYKSVLNTSIPIGLHYTGGIFGSDDEETLKKQQAKEFVKKIKEEKKAYFRKMRELGESLEAKKLEDLERYQKKMEEEEERRFKEKKEKMEVHIKTLEAGTKTRAKNLEDWKEDYSAYLSKKPMYRQIQDNFKKAIVIPELEERKKKLQEIRDFHKPIYREDIIEHQQKVQKAFDDKQELRRREEGDSKWSYQKPAFESSYHQTFAEETVNNRRKRELEVMDCLKRKERIMELMHDVKEKHLPKVDPQKELELMSMVEKLNNRNKKKNRKLPGSVDEDDFDDYTHGRKLGDDYLKAARELGRKNLMSKTVAPSATVSEKTNDDNFRASELLKSESSAPVLKKRNYLADLRKENKLNTVDKSVDIIIKNKDLDHKVKKELLKSEVEKLEEKAKRLEMKKKFAVKKSESNQGQDDEVDQMYINAIKAKLEMLFH